MAMPSTLYRLHIALSHVDRGVYEQLDLRVAQHPSETARYLAARVLAYCLLFTEGLAFSKGGLSDPDEPALSIRSLDGTLQAWVEIGTPSADRLHRASKAAPRLVVVTHNDPALLLKEANTSVGQGREVHKRESIEAFALAPAFLDEVAGQLSRNAKWELTITDNQIYLTSGDVLLSGAFEPLSLA
jgi:uncharacterized protein YaeQ